MCWNKEVSLFSALIGWGTCIYLRKRKRSERDIFYSNYLLTFTLTQIADIILWSLNDKFPLQSCKSYQEQFFSYPDTDQFWNFMVSKYLIPLIVFSQHWRQCDYPSTILKEKRLQLKLLHLIPIIIMSFAFGCTRLIQTNFFPKGNSLFWGGDFTHWPFLMIQVGATLHSGLVAYIFYLLMPGKIAFVHLATLAGVVSTLIITEQRMDLGSKWCTYCLIYSVVYIAEPIWLKEPKKEAIRGDEYRVEPKGFLENYKINVKTKKQ